jgi:FAD/FMN-containing dehydrogenase
MATQTTTLGDATIAELQAAVRGPVIRPGDADYDAARAVWNGYHDRHPALVVRCLGTADVVRSLELARSEGLEVSVRGGGHSIPGFSTTDGGLVIDLSLMRGVHVEPKTIRAIAQPGATWGDYDAETQVYGLATTGGLISTTGVAGFTLGGGIGWLMRKHGLSCDNLLAADVVTADGTLVRASDDDDAELLWALRGGGGNFGVVTSFELDLHPVGPTVYGGPIFYDGARAGEVLRRFREWTAEAPDEMTAMATMLTAPPAPFLPTEWHGRKLIGVMAVWSGALEGGEGAMAGLRALGDPVADLCGPIPYRAVQSLLDPLWPKGIVAYFKSGFLPALSDEVIDLLTARHLTMTSPQQEIHIHHMGGAVGRVGQDFSPFPDRTSPYVINVLAGSPTRDGFDEHTGWCQDTYAAAEEYTSGKTYVNFMAQGDDRIRQAYTPETFARLQAVKRRLDPDNTFRLNQNIPPA